MNFNINVHNSQLRNPDFLSYSLYGNLSMTSTPTVQKGKNMKLKIALLSVAMSSAYIFSGSVFAAEKYEIALVAKVNGIPWFNRMGRKGSCR
jgi:hypothetical protein